MSDRPDVLVVGAGPGGYPAAIKAAQLGLATACVEREALGGVCLNWGCIPSKALIHAGHVYEHSQHSERMGITAKEVSLDMPKLIEWKDGIVKRLTGGVGQLLKGNKVAVHEGTARFLSPTKVEIAKRDGAKTTLEPKHVIIATGASPIQLPGLAVDGKHVLGARELLDQKTLPRRMVVIGGGVIGLELGMAFANLGSKVTVVELLDGLLWGVDRELVKWVERSLKKLDVKVMLRSKVTAYKEQAGELHVSVTDKDGKDPTTVVCDKILSAVGFRPNTQGLGLEAAGVKTDSRGHILIDKHCRTNVPHIFAIGDVSGPPYLAHKATKEGIIAAEVIAGHHAELDYRALPGAIFTDPEVATVGLNEEQAAKQGIKVKVGKFPFSALGRAQTLSEPPAPGVVKLIVDASTGVILGAGIAGAGASDLIAEVAVAIEMGALAEDVCSTIHAHPTLAEAIMEAGESATYGKSIHAL